MTYKQKICKQIIENMEAWRKAAWADHIDKRTKDEVINVMQNVVTGVSHTRQSFHTITNGDKIRAMKDIKLAKWVCSVHGTCPRFCPMADDCDGENCDGAWLGWLKQEEKND